MTSLKVILGGSRGKLDFKPFFSELIRHNKFKIHSIIYIVGNIGIIDILNVVKCMFNDI